MKKIIATVLAVVMVMALSVTAFAAVTYTAYDKTGKKVIDTEVTYDSLRASYNKDNGTGTVAAYRIDDLGGIYVAAPDAKTYDLKLTTPGKSPLYLTQVATNYYEGKATAFKTVGDACEQLDVESMGYDVKTDVFYTTTNPTTGDVSYWVVAEGTDTYVLVGGNMVEVEHLDDNLDMVGHDWEASKYDASGKNVAEYTCKECKTVAKVYPSKDAATADGMKKFDDTLMIGYNFTPKGETAAANTTTTNSPKTFDAGVAMYAGMALMSVAGSAVVIGKKKEF